MLYYITYKTVAGVVVERPFTEKLDVVLDTIKKKGCTVISVQHT